MNEKDNRELIPSLEDIEKAYSQGGALTSSLGAPSFGGDEAVQSVTQAVENILFSEKNVNRITDLNIHQIEALIKVRTFGLALHPNFYDEEGKPLEPEIGKKTPFLVKVDRIITKEYKELMVSNRRSGRREATAILSSLARSFMPGADPAFGGGGSQAANFGAMLGGGNKR